jgi:hypothetical protein
MDIKIRVERLKEKIQSIYKLTAEVVAELDSIESDKEWLSLSGFENSTFKFFYRIQF